MGKKINTKVDTVFKKYFLGQFEKLKNNEKKNKITHTEKRYTQELY